SRSQVRECRYCQQYHVDCPRSTCWALRGDFSPKPRIQANIERSRLPHALGMERFPHAVLLKVGLDFTLGGVLGPTTDAGPLDGKREFEYIPFPQWESPTKTQGK